MTWWDVELADGRRELLEGAVEVTTAGVLVLRAVEPAHREDRIVAAFGVGRWVSVRAQRERS